jgi:isoquinoline 1-oxidoreductase beta subunit
VFHPASDRVLHYGELVSKAAEQPVPKEPVLKSPEQFRLIGTSIPRLDTPAKVSGKAEFGMDVRLPGMLTAAVARCPTFGGHLIDFDSTGAQAVSGVRSVLRIRSGVAVVADSFWAALRGREALRIHWEDGPKAPLASADIAREYASAARKRGAVARSEGDTAAALAGAAKRIEAVYRVPFLAHSPMEPMNCTADVSGDRCVIWAPTQCQTGAKATAVEITGLPTETVEVHTTFLGGGFGRRFEQDFVAEAVEVSKEMGLPVKVGWSREDDIRHDFYRPATHNVLSAGLDGRGRPVAWTNRIVGPSILQRTSPDSIRDGIDRFSIQGADNLRYSVPNIRVEYVMKDLGVPVGFWRSLGYSQNVFVTECFLDEIAVAGGNDPYELRIDLLDRSPRLRAVLETAAEAAGWNTRTRRGMHRGIAAHAAAGSYVAQVAEVSVAKGGRVTVHKVVCAVDCGIVINPDIVEAQMHSGIVFGLTAALHGEITVKDGQVVQSNIHDYPLLRMDEMPEIDVHIVSNGRAPGGVGELATPPIAPAVANAVFAATGRPVRELPIRVTS